MESTENKGTEILASMIEKLYDDNKELQRSISYEKECRVRTEYKVESLNKTIDSLKKELKEKD